MPLPLVLVEIAPPDAPAQLVSTLIRACSEGTRRADCAVPDERRGSATWGIAIISWRNDAETRVWVEVGRHGAHRGTWRSREVRFSEADERVERWRTVGFTIATLAEETELAARQANQADAKTDARNADGDADPAREQRSVAASAETPGRRERGGPAPRPLWLSVGALAAPALDDGSWRGGGFARASYSPTRLQLFATTSARLAVRDSGRPAAARWASFTVGLGVFALVRPVRLDLRGEVLFESLHISATDPDSDASDSAARWVTGVCGGIQAAWPARGPLGLVAGAELWRMRESTGIFVGGERAGASPALGWTLLAGAEWRIR